MKPFTLLGMNVCLYAVHSTHALVYSKLLNLGILEKSYGIPFFVQEVHVCSYRDMT